MIKQTSKALLGAAGTVVILPHISPDGDTIGSAVALYHGLKGLGKDVYIVLDDKLPDDFGYIATDIVMTTEQFKALGRVQQTAICVDLSDLERLGARRALTDADLLINIDHHRTNTQFGDVRCVDAAAAATAEVIFRLLQAMQLTLTPQMAEALYIGIVTDTGNFKYNSTTAQTLRIAAELIDIPFDRNAVINKLYHSIPRAKVALQAHAVANARFFDDAKIAVCTVSAADFERFAALDEYSDGIVEAVRDIAGVEVVIFVKQRGADMAKISMRSIEAPDVSAIAFKHGGGGHKNAAGFSLNMPFGEAVDYCCTELVDEVRACMALS